jgi:hypothetical protein
MAEGHAAQQSIPEDDVMIERSQHVERGQRGESDRQITVRDKGRLDIETRRQGIARAAEYNCRQAGEDAG